MNQRMVFLIIEIQDSSTVFLIQLHGRQCVRMINIQLVVFIPIREAFMVEIILILKIIKICTNIGAINHKIVIQERDNQGETRYFRIFKKLSVYLKMHIRTCLVKRYCHLRFCLLILIHESEQILNIPSK